MESSIYQPDCDRENRSIQCAFSGFDAPSDTIVRQEVMTSLSNKTCFLDSIPTLVVKGNIDSKVKSDHRSKFSNLSNWKEEA